MRPLRQSILALVTTGLLLALAVNGASASLPAKAQALVPQRSLAGVKIGMIASQVRAVLGRPSSNKVSVRPILGKVRTMDFGATEVLFRGTAATAPVNTISTSSHGERTAQGVGVGSTEAQLVAKLSGEHCLTELGYRHCFIGKWSKGFVVTDFSIANRRVTLITLGVITQ